MLMSLPLLFEDSHSPVRFANAAVHLAVWTNMSMLISFLHYLTMITFGLQQNCVTVFYPNIKAGQTNWEIHYKPKTWAQAVEYSLSLEKMWDKFQSILHWFIISGRNLWELACFVWFWPSTQRELSSFSWMNPKLKSKLRCYPHKHRAEKMCFEES